MKNNSQEKEVGIGELIAAGNSLYGEKWQAEMSRALKLKDAKRIREWLRGRTIPKGVWDDLLKLLEANQEAIMISIQDIRELLSKMDHDET